MTCIAYAELDSSGRDTKRLHVQIAHIKRRGILQWVFRLLRCPLTADVIIVSITTILALLVLANKDEVSLVDNIVEAQMFLPFPGSKHWVCQAYRQ